MALNLGSMKHMITIENPTNVTSGGDTTQTWSACSPSTAKASIGAVPGKVLDRLKAGTIVAQASYLITLRFHAQIDVGTRVRWTNRKGDAHTAHVVDVEDVDNLSVEMRLVAQELTS